ncbi:MAG: hypothetical protein LBD72_02870 [Puniceicoccales bacterium]|nr:hypothetical protein [Puniceicoccales bacterium]
MDRERRSLDCAMQGLGGKFGDLSLTGSGVGAVDIIRKGSAGTGSFGATFPRGLCDPAEGFCKSGQSIQAQSKKSPECWSYGGINCRQRWRQSRHSRKRRAGSQG